MALADHQGNVVGGHVLEGCEVFTTAEIVIGECVNHVFSREHDGRPASTNSWSPPSSRCRCRSAGRARSCPRPPWSNPLPRALRQRQTPRRPTGDRAADDEFTFAPAPVSDANADANLDRRHDGVDASTRTRFVNDAVSSRGPRPALLRGRVPRDAGVPEARVEHIVYEPAPMAQLTDWRAKDARRKQARGCGGFNNEEEAAQGERGGSSQAYPSRPPPSARAGEGGRRGAEGGEGGGGAERAEKRGNESND